MKKIGFKESRLSIDNYFEWRKNRSQLAVDRVNKTFNLKGKKVLDIGCGYGALSDALSNYGAEVWGTEINQTKFNIAKQKLLKHKNITLIKVNNEILNFDDNFFDCIFIFDVIEHVKNPQKTIEESYRVLKPEGYLYIEFTPYYSITGHHLYDFAKWPIHILPPDKIKKIVFSKKIKGIFDSQYFWEQFESLNKLRISNFQKMISKFKKIEEKFIIKYPEVFEINLPFINFLGPFKDYFTMSFEGLYKK